MPEPCVNASCAPSKPNVLPWLAILTAVGLSAAAYVIATKARAENAVVQTDDLLEICERAASQLDARLSTGFSVAS